jgi:hypothetical protein
MKRTAAGRRAARFGGANITSAAAGKPCTVGFGYNLRTRHLLRSEPRSDFLSQLPPSPLPTIDKSAFGATRCDRVIAKAHRPYRWHPSSENHKRRIPAVLYGSTGAGNNWHPTGDKTNATRGATNGSQVWLWLSPPCSEARGKPLIGEGLRREERLLSRTRVCVDRVGDVDDLSEGYFRLPSPPTPARSESDMSLGQASPT